MISVVDTYVLIAIILSISMYGFWVSRRLYKKRGFCYRIYYILSILLILTSIYPLLTYNNPNRLTISLGIVSGIIGVTIWIVRTCDICLVEIYY